MRSIRFALWALLAVLLGAGHSTAAPELAATTSSVTVTKGGTGSGTVTANAGAISCGATCVDMYSDGASLTLTAVPAAGSQFTGWLGPCAGTAACQFVVGGNTTAIATFAPASLGTPTLDVDGSGGIAPLTDGLLAMRWLFGLSGSMLIDGAVAPMAPRATPEAIGDFLANIRPLLDIDGNGQTDALTDGVLIVRYLFGLRGDGLVEGVIGPGAARSTFTDIVASLDTLTTLGSGLPADPADVAPPVDASVATNLLGATGFLYSGPNPIQTGVVPGTITAQRVAVLRGTVRDRQDAALPGVTIAILAHPELGQTKSRADGAFDIAVNGGGALTVTYRKTGFLPVQRTINTPWADYARVPDVVMIPLDTAVTAVALGAGSVQQVARGNIVTDADGPRRATVVFPAGTSATMTLANGTVQPLSALNVRATEYTVGANGPSAMPGALPASSGYTYAVELSVDEAIAAGATMVTFSQPVPSYVENFVGLPVGTLVPAGYYDYAAGLWKAGDNGRVIKVLAITGGSADLDLDGSGVAAGAVALAALGIADAERQRLALLYAAGQTLWRVLLPHFSPWDYNFPYGPPPGAAAPDGGGPPGTGPQPNGKPKGGEDKDCGSVIGCESQTLGESIDVTGTPLTLQYQSDRVVGRRDTKIVRIRLSGATLPPGLQHILLEVSVAGQKVTKSFAPQANLFDTFTWDGKDAYGRTVQGQWPVKIRIGYEYIAQYYATPDLLDASYNRFGLPPISVSSGGGGGGGAIIFSRPPVRDTMPPIVLWREYESSAGHLNADFGGWTLNVRHAYDSLRRTIYFGTGEQRSAVDTGQPVIVTAAGNGLFGSIGDNGPATLARVGSPTGIAVGPDGSVYIADASNKIRKVAPDGIITTVAGSGVPGYAGDGGPATLAQIYTPQAVAIGPDGSLYIADFNNLRIRRVAPNGIISTLAGTGAFGFSGDGGPAALAKIGSPLGVAVGPDGTVYFTDGSRIRRVTPDGIITTAAGNGIDDFSGDNGPATLAAIAFPWGIAVDADGNLYIADRGNLRVRKVTVDGIITTIAGLGGSPGFAGDGGLATAARLSSPHGVAVGRDGSVFLTDYDNQRIRRVGPDGVIRTLTGTGFPGYLGDGGPAMQARIFNAQQIAVAPDGSVYFADGNNQRVRQIRPPLLGIAVGATVVASPDARELYAFNDTGRHLQTLDALTGAVLFQFTYNASGALTGITDVDGNTTSIERSAGGSPTAIVAPFGQRTELAVDAAGYLASVSAPGGATVALTYATGDAEGLLTSLTDARGGLHQYAYDTLGRLASDANPAGGTKALTRTELGDGHYRVTVTRGSGLVSSHEVEELPSGTTRRLRTAPGGAVTETLLNPDGSTQITYPDGVVLTTVEGPDPRFGMQSPVYTAVTVAVPGGLTSTRTTTRSATLSDPANLLSLATLTESIVQNGQTWTTSYNAGTRTITATSPAGRSAKTVLDAKGHVVTVQADPDFGLAPRQLAYDVHGRLTSSQQGTQSWTYAYDASSRLTSRTNAAGAAMALAYDAAGRASQITLPGGRIYGIAHDANGNRSQVTMPGAAVHLQGNSALDLESSYTPPANAPYTIARDTDARMSLVTLPGGRTESFAYDAKNRLAGITYAEATLALSYGASDNTARIAGLVRTPAGGGTAQAIAATYAGALVTNRTFSGVAQGQFAYTYDTSFRLQNTTLTSGVDTVTTAVTRDADGLPTAVGPYTMARAGPRGAPTQIGDGTLAVALTYDALGRIAGRTLSVAGVQKYAIQLVYDNVGRIVSKAETVAGATTTLAYAYDPLGQLTQVQRNAAIAETYAYDPDRNRSSRKFGAGAVESATYDAQDRLTQQGAVTYQSNVDGYLVARGASTFVFSTAGELLQAGVSGQTVTFSYDGLRRRTGRTDANGTTQYLYGNPDDALLVTQSRNPAGVLTTYFYDEGRRLFALQRGASRYYVGSDQLGSPRVVTDSAGAVVKVVEYDGFGVPTQDSSPAFELPIGFAGGLTDATTGFVRFGLRDYDPAAGRWTARDPATFGGGQANLYAYVGNDPVGLVDPSGFGSAGVGVCEGVCVGFKLGITDKGISACVEAGFGVGNSVDVDPMGDLDKNEASLEAKVALKAGIAKFEYGLEVNDDPCGKPQGKRKSEVCVGPACANTGNEGKLSGDFEPDLKVKNPLKGGGLGAEGKIVGKVCQQALW